LKWNTEDASNVPGVSAALIADIKLDPGEHHNADAGILTESYCRGLLTET